MFCLFFFTALIALVSWMVVDFLAARANADAREDWWETLTAPERRWANFWALLALITTFLALVELLIMGVLAILG